MSIFSAAKEFSEPEIYKKFPKTGNFFYWELEFDIAQRARKYQNKGFDVSSVLDDMKIKAFLKANPDVSLEGAQSA